MPIACELPGDDGPHPVDSAPRRPRRNSFLVRMLVAGATKIRTKNDQASWSRRWRTRLGLTGPWTPTGWANTLTRSSSSSHPTSTSSGRAHGAPPGGREHGPVALLEREDLGHPPHVAGDVLGQAVQPVLDPPDVAVHVGQTAGCRRSSRTPVAPAAPGAGGRRRPTARRPASRAARAAARPVSTHPGSRPPWPAHRRRCRVHRAARRAATRRTASASQGSVPWSFDHPVDSDHRGSRSPARRGRRRCRRAPGGRPDRADAATSRVDGAAVSSSSRRTPPRITRSCRSGSSAPAATRCRRRRAAPGSPARRRPRWDISTTWGTVPTSHVTIPRRSSIGARSAIAARASGARRARIGVEVVVGVVDHALGIGDDHVHHAGAPAPQPGANVIRRDAHPAHVGERSTEPVDEPAPRRTEPLQCRPRRVGGGDQSAPDLLGQRPHRARPPARRGGRGSASRSPRR